MRHVAVVVLGDVGRSPRMQYHALSLAADKATRRVTLIGYVGEKCVPPVEAHAKIHQQLMEPVELQSLRRRVPFLIYAVVKVLLLFWRFGVTLMWRTPGPLDAVLVQNPPALPTLAVAWLVCRLRGAKLVVDWHNLGYSVLAFELGKPTDTAHPAVAWPRAAETWLAARADAHFCVTHAMAAFLRTKLTPRGTTSARLALSALHDRPPRFFAHTALEAQHALFVRLEKDFVWPQSFCDASGSTSADVTPFTTVERQADGAQAVALRGERPALLVSSTSWSSDEDFSVLLDALIEYDRKAVLAMRRTQTSERLPPVVCVVTGKGPQKAMYLEVGKGGPPMRHLAVLITSLHLSVPCRKHVLRQRIRALSLQRVAVRTVWLEPADYPTLLGTADLGICLHASTSGLDLPMKVLDMFGCGVPVSALRFGCIGELVREGENGRTFTDSAELAAQLCSLLSGFPDHADELRTLRQGVGQMVRWEENWQTHAAPVFDALLATKRDD